MQQYKTDNHVFFSLTTPLIVRGLPLSYMFCIGVVVGALFLYVGLLFGQMEIMYFLVPLVIFCYFYGKRRTFLDPFWWESLLAHLKFHNFSLNAIKDELTYIP